MGSYYGYVILPRDLNVSEEKVIWTYVDAVLKKYEPIDELNPVEGIHFFHHVLASKEWYSEFADWRADFPSAIEGTDLIISPISKFHDNDAFFAVITPDGQWHQSRATYACLDPEWPEEFNRLCAPFVGHLGVVVYFKC